MPVQFKCTSSWLTLPGLVKFLIKRRQLWLCDVILRAAGNLPSDSDNYDMVWRKGWLQTCSFNLHIMQEETTSKCLQMQRLGGTQRQTDGGTKHPADWSDRNRQRCRGGHEAGVGGGGAEKVKKKKKKPRSAVRSCVVRGTLLCEPTTAVSGTASVHVIRHRVSGSSPSHFVPPLTASRPDCVTATQKKRRHEEEGRATAGVRCQRSGN